MRGTGKKFTGAKGKQRNCGLGDGIINARKATQHQKPAPSKQTTDFFNAMKQITSIVDESDFLTIVANAHLAKEEFTAKREMRIVNPDEEMQAKPDLKQ